MEGSWMDIRHALRSLARSPGFAVVTALTLALGIAASTTLFSTVYAVLFRPLPYDSPDRVAAVFHESRETGERADGFSAANARDLSERAERLAGVAVAEPWSMDLEVDGRALSLRGWAVSEGFFRIVGIQPQLGRTFLPEEYDQGAEPVVVLSDGAWRNRFGADPRVVGGAVHLDGGPQTVVGVLPPEFRLPGDADFWMPRW